MRALRTAFLCAAALAAGTAAASAAGSPAPPRQPLPPGLTQQGGVIMMQPITDSDSGETGDEKVPPPSPERRPGSITALSAADHDLYTKAFDAADHGDWTAARGLADQGHDPVARRIITWRYLTDRNGGASFAEISGFLRDYPDWPLRDVLLARAEQAMPAGMDPGAVIGWFAGRTPETGIGKVRLGEALMATGHRSEGIALIRKAWTDDSFEPYQERAVIAAHGDILRPEDEQARLEHLLWRGDLDGARRQMSRVDAGARRVALVRLALQRDPAKGIRMERNLPSALRADPGLIFDQARALNHNGDGDEVPGLLVRAPTRELARIGPGRMWGELAVAARQALKVQDYRTAYRLVSNTGLKNSVDLADAEFLAGWIALRFLHDPESALPHFRALTQRVGRPISLSRGHYWMGRAYEAEGDLAKAVQSYRLAADIPDTFYGQLALARIESAPRLSLPDTPADPAGVRAAYEKSDIVRAIHVLGDLGAGNLLRLFAVRYAEDHTNAGSIDLLAGDLTRMGFRNVAVRVAKIASYSDISLPSYSHPVIALPRYAGPGTAPDEALVLGVIRQETEFNEAAVSPAGAVGIMQIMPSTARHTARIAGLAYRPSGLRDDTPYNIQIGMAELASDLTQWDGSYILAAAAYNAGNSNVERWIATYGDPRDPGVDPVDWIEQIPFSETRNYVERVLENIEVYRDRLAGHSQPLQILADLYRPRAPAEHVLKYVPPAVPTAKSAPVPRPTARPAVSSEMLSAVPSDSAADPPAPPVLPTPVARPGQQQSATPADPPKR
ncbi:MAG: transglycosylase SLT domain-containing protein [Alphaproteobacteria bacterium]|nr:transglycosylase SLT domain-containing protein [Alphaproteobacteria bacterium]